MSRIKTCGFTTTQLDDLMKALNLTRNDIPRVCQGVSSSAYGWWRSKEQVPYVHLHAFGKELERQLKLRPKTEIDKKVEKDLILAFALENASGSAMPVSKQSVLHTSFSDSKPQKDKPKGMRDLLKLATQEEIINELHRRGGTVTFSPKKTRKS